MLARRLVDLERRRGPAERTHEQLLGRVPLGLRAARGAGILGESADIGHEICEAYGDYGDDGDAHKRRNGDNGDKTESYGWLISVCVLARPPQAGAGVRGPREITSA